MLIGLHVCGELVPLMEHLYSNSDCIKALVCVGCCYYRMGTPSVLSSALSPFALLLLSLSSFILFPSFSARLILLTLSSPSAYKDEKTKQFETHGHPLSNASRRAFEAASGVAKGLPHCLSPGALSLACESTATWTAMSADEFDWMLRATFYR